MDDPRLAWPRPVAGHWSEAEWVTRDPETGKTTPTGRVTAVIVLTYPNGSHTWLQDTLRADNTYVSAN